jgi:hypothetical protein
METKTRSLVSVALCLLVRSMAYAADAQQYSFSAEDGTVKHPVSVPPEVNRILAQDRQVRDVLEYEHIVTDTIPSSWLLASEIHLSNSGERDLVVIAEGPLLGADVTTFWIFRTTNHKYQLLLNAPAHDLVVENTRTNGYRDIELLSATAVTVSTVLCRFKGGTYIPAAKKLEPIRQMPSPFIRVHRWPVN